MQKVIENIVKKIICLTLCLCLNYSTANANFAEHYDLAQQYLSQYQYSSAVSEFKKALRINYLDNSARIGLINSYLARGTYFANKDRNWEKAANDYRAALFYLKYYPSIQDVQNSEHAISNSTQNLNKCLSMLKSNTSSKSRYQKAISLRLQGRFPEAGYEFAQSVSDSSLKKNAYEQIADIMNVLGNNPKGAEYYKKAIVLNKEDSGLRLKYARVLDKLGKNDAAVKEYNYALLKSENDPEILYALQRIYEQKLAQTPKNPAIITNLGAILQKQNKYDEALKYYSKAGRLDPSNVTNRLNIGTLYQQKKSYDSAIAAYDSILTLYPNNVDANIYKSQCLALKGQTNLAMAGFKKVLRLEPTNKEAKNQIFYLMKKTMTPVEWITYLGRQVATDKTAINDMYDYAIELHKQKKFDDAIIGYQRVLRLKSNNPEIYLNLAIAYKDKGDSINANLVLKNAKKRFPKDTRIARTLKAWNDEESAYKFNEASDYYNNKDYKKALASYQSMQPPTFESLSGIAACYKNLNNEAQSIAYYMMAFNIRPDSNVAYYLGVLYSDREDWNSSKTYLEKALKLNPKNFDAKELLMSVMAQLNTNLVDNAIALYEKSNYVKALTIFNKVLRNDSKNAYAYYYKGLINDAGKKRLMAIADYKKAIKYNSNLIIVYYLMAIDYDSLSQYKSALINYKKYVLFTKEIDDYKTYSQSRIIELKKNE